MCLLLPVRYILSLGQFVCCVLSVLSALMPILTQFTPFCYPKRKLPLAPKHLEIFFK